jgi:ferredoxin
MIARIDPGKCRGHGQCELIAPEVFRLGEDDRGQVIADGVPDGLSDAVGDAVVMCPEGAIEVMLTTAAAQLPPEPGGETRAPARRGPEPLAVRAQRALRPWAVVLVRRARMTATAKLLALLVRHSSRMLHGVPSPQLFGRLRSARRCLCSYGVSRPVGRILCTRLRGPAVIHLGLPLPAASCGLPASIGRAALDRSRRPAADDDVSVAAADGPS